MGFGAFMKRRLHRIAPPYVASCLLAIGLRQLWKNIPPFVTELGMYLQNLVMMQWVSIARAQFGGGLVPRSASDNPRLVVAAYWSLNYEEQFYLIAGLLVVLGLVWRARAAAAALVAITVGVAAVNFARPGLVTGLFCDYWLQFACGVALFVRLCKMPTPRAARLFDVVLGSALAASVVVSLRHGELSLDPHAYHSYGQLTFCLAFAGLLLVLRPVDGWLAKTIPGRLFGGLGKFSYSLYLIHIPVVGALGFLEKRLEPRIGTVGCDLFIVTAVLGSSYCFYRLFERPFLNRPLSDQSAPAAEAPVADLPGGERVAL
jgi:peptidoglycan/LPS O-acetylase OafA/YrhL